MSPEPICPVCGWDGRHGLYPAKSLAFHFYTTHAAGFDQVIYPMEEDFQTIEQALAYCHAELLGVQINDGN